MCIRDRIYILSLVVITVGIAAVLIHYINKQTLLENIRQKSNLHLSGWLYKSSILLQLFVSIGFIFCTFVIMKQLNFLQNSRELDVYKRQKYHWWQLPSVRLLTF